MSIVNRSASNRKSKIDLLPDEIRQTLNAFIRSGNMTQKDIRLAVNEMIDDAGLPEDVKISRTGFNRYAKRMEEMGQRLKQSREVAEVWTTKLGEAPTSDVGKLLQEFVRTMAFETSMAMMESAAEDGEVIPPKALAQLALVIQRIEQASMVSHKVEKEIRAAFAAEVADATEAIVKQAGVTAETIQDIKKGILGIA
ncbi:Mu-like prophage FluMu protein gp27 [Vibrio crassostreae]|nr:Mu-like prophage FluMu protein gp27 [Vibrio crassostreae]